MPLCTEKQARAAAYILTRNVRIQYSPQLERGLNERAYKLVVQRPGVAQFLKITWKWAKEQGYKYAQVYAWE